MIRKYHNHKPQTTPWHREEEPLNHHETPGRQIKQSNQLSLPHQDSLVFLVSRDGWVVLPCGAMGLSAVCDCGISWSYSLTIFAKNDCFYTGHNGLWTGELISWYYRVCHLWRLKRETVLRLFPGVHRIKQGLYLRLNCGHVRKCAMLSIIFWKIYL